ncbi:hypothetical protein M5K25_000972 [Dendrobium thyrsiflorum]|uniref:Uncharacterized protein n=1 Tax=Dendrobium thyrsiflorum TaxID=117978 RepID=A0ABD0WBP3_DENTH
MTFHQVSLVRMSSGTRLIDMTLEMMLTSETDWSSTRICCRGVTLSTAFSLVPPCFHSVLRTLYSLRTPTGGSLVLDCSAESTTRLRVQSPRLVGAPVTFLYLPQIQLSQLGSQSPVNGYVCWARYVLQAHRGTLQEAGIYEAVYASLFDYGHLPTSWARGLVEFWDASRGTYWVGAEELTLTLSDLQTVSGLPVFGRPFEECVPPDEQLFFRVPSADGDRRGRLVLPDVYPVLLEYYRRVYRASGLSARARVGMPVDVWLRSFLQDSYLTAVGASVCDPFGLDLPRGVPLSEETAEPSLVAGYPSPVLPGVTEDLFLAGFLATSLCTFVLPLRAGFVCYSALLAASQLSQGQRLSLAPAVLARIYRSLRTASEATSL